MKQISRISHHSWLWRRRIDSFVRYRVIGRTLSILNDRLAPFSVVSGGTDCDGMRWASCSFYWSRASCERSVEDTYSYCDGPTNCYQLTGRQGREWVAEYEPDTRDRFAENMGY